MVFLRKPLPLTTVNHNKIDGSSAKSSYQHDSIRSALSGASPDALTASKILTVGSAFGGRLDACIKHISLIIVF
jgi:hypothetical protein